MEAPIGCKGKVVRIHNLSELGEVLRQASCERQTMQEMPTRAPKREQEAEQSVEGEQHPIFDLLESIFMGQAQAEAAKQPPAAEVVDVKAFPVDPEMAKKNLIDLNTCIVGLATNVPEDVSRLELNAMLFEVKELALRAIICANSLK